MKFRTLIRRSLRFHLRAHLGVVLGAAVGTAALAGALMVGDSVRFSLRQMAVERLGPVHFAIQTGDRPFQVDLMSRLRSAGSSEPVSVNGKPVAASDLQVSAQATALRLAGTLARQDGAARANHVNVLGVDRESWPWFASWSGLGGSPVPGRPQLGQSIWDDAVKASRLGLPGAVLSGWQAGEEVLVNEALARHLGVEPGDEVILRVRKPSATGQEAVISPQDENAVALRLKVGPVLPASMLGNFNLAAVGGATFNAFLPLQMLERRLGLSGEANLLVSGPVVTNPKRTWWDNQKRKWLAWAAYKGLIKRSRAYPKKPLPPTELPSATATTWLTSRLANAWRLEDAGLQVEALEIPQSATGGEYIGPWVQVSSKRIFLDAPVVEAALQPRTRSLPDHPAFIADQWQDLAASRALTNGMRVFTHLANLIQAGSRAAPYSMVTAADSPIVPTDMTEEEILVNEWLAEDLQVKVGDPVQVSYYLADSGSALVERTNVFRVRAVVPIKGFYADRSLMPEFPGLAKAERTQDWDAGFDLTHEIRDKDEAYWKQYRGTPKAFITLAAGQKLWANRFGALTAIRYAVPTNTFPSVWRELAYLNLLANLHPAQVGLTVQPVRAEALAGAGQGQDFGQLFLGFSFFLVMAALLLMALMFRLGLEQRAEEIGICLAMGLTGRQVRRWLLLEGSALALAGSVLGVLGGVLYARAMLWGLATVWRDAIGNSSLVFSVSTGTLVIGFLAGAVVGVSTIALGLRRFTRQPARELLAGRFAEVRKNDGKRSLAVAVTAGAAALGLLVWAFMQQQSHAGAFFGAAALVLVAGIALASTWLKRPPGSSGAKSPSLGIVGLRACARRPSRSLSVIALLACGTFLIGAIGVFRQDARRDATRPGSGTGGFALIGESALPLVRDLNTQTGREAFGLEAGPGAAAVRVVPFRIREGDEASCLNLGRAQRPRLAGVNPDGLSGRFTFKRVAAGLDQGLGWQLLRNRGAGENAIPAIGDANSIQWALGKKLGDTLEYTDERGRSFQIRIVGAVANSVLQGMLIIDEQAFVEKFPGESGYRWFLMDAPAGGAKGVAAAWSRALEDYGMELTPATERLNQFNAVQNTYLGTFQLLGGLGLLLGSAGVGIVLFRNVLERRGELAVLTAMGFRRRTLARLLLSEHGALMTAGLGLGVLAAALAVLPAVLVPGEQLPWSSLGLTLGAVAMNGLLCVWLATRMALRGSLLIALRNE